MVSGSLLPHTLTREDIFVILHGSLNFFAVEAACEITLGQTKNDNIKRKITITGDFYLVTSGPLNIEYG